MLHAFTILKCYFQLYMTYRIMIISDLYRTGYKVFLNTPNEDQMLILVHIAVLNQVLTCNEATAYSFLSLSGLSTISSSDEMSGSACVAGVSAGSEAGSATSGNSSWSSSSSDEIATTHNSTWNNYTGSHTGC